MRVLWFTNTSCTAAHKLAMDEIHGGWLSSLESELAYRKDINLFICFYSNKEYQPFTLNKTTYYPIYRNNAASKLKRLFRRFNGPTKYDIKEVQNLLIEIDNIKPDLIHIHGTEENFGLIQHFLKIPIIVSLQGILAPCHEKYFSGIPKTVTIRYENIISKILFESASKIAENMKKRAIREKKILERARFIIGRTEWDRRVSRILAPNSIYYSVNELLRRAFYNCTFKETIFDGKIKIVTTMGSEFYKGFETIVKTATLLSSIKDLDYEWNIIGIPENCEIVSIVCKWLKSDLEKIKIRLLGYKNENELVQILSESNIFCQVSHIENSSNSLCEAMLIGKPIVATFAGGTSSLIEDLKEGILVQEGDIYSIAGAIMEYLMKPELANYCAKNARLKAIQRHDKRKITDELVAVYNKILNLSTSYETK